MRWLISIPFLVAMAHAQITAQKPIYSLHWQPTSAQTTLINAALAACAGSHTNGDGHIWCVPATTGPNNHNQTAAAANGLAMWNLICGSGGNCPNVKPATGYGGAVGVISSGGSLVGEVMVVPADSWIFPPVGPNSPYALAGGICNSNNTAGQGCNGQLVEIDQPAVGGYPGGYVAGVFPATPLIIISSNHANFPPLGTRAIPENGDGGWNQPKGQVANVCGGATPYVAPSGATRAEIAEGSALAQFYKAGCTGSDYYTLVDYNGHSCIQGSNGANGYVFMDMECTTYASYSSANWPDVVSGGAQLTQMIAPGMTGSRPIMIHDTKIIGQDAYAIFTTALRLDTGAEPLIGHCWMSNTPPTGLTSTPPPWPDCGIIEPGIGAGATYYIYLVGRNGVWEQPSGGDAPSGGNNRGSNIVFTWSGLDAPADHMEVQPLNHGTGPGQCPTGQTTGGLAIGQPGAGRGGLCVIDATHAWAAVEAQLTSPRNGGVYNFHVETIPASLPAGCSDNCSGAFRSVFHDALVVDQGISITWSCPTCPVQPMNGGKQLIVNAGGGAGTITKAIQYPITATYNNGVNSGNFSVYASQASGFLGSGYLAGDVLQLTNVSTGATVAGKIVVDSVASGGAILTYHLTTDPIDIGPNGVANVTRTVTGGTGTGARFVIGGSRLLAGVELTGAPIHFLTSVDQIVDVVNKTISGAVVYAADANGASQFGYLGANVKMPGQQITNRPFFTIAGNNGRGADTPSLPYEITVSWRAASMTNNATNGIDYCALYNPNNTGIYAGFDRYNEANLANGSSGTLECYGIGTHWTDIGSCSTNCDWGQSNNPGIAPPPGGTITGANPGIMNLGANIHINSWTAISDTELRINISVDSVAERGAWNMVFVHNWIHGYDWIVTADSRQQHNVDGSAYVPCRQTAINCVAVYDSAINTGFDNRASNIELSDSVIDHIHDSTNSAVDQKASAGIGGLNINTHNSSLSASAIIWFTGGAGADFARSPAKTSDVEFDHNYMWRPESWVNGGVSEFVALSCHASTINYTQSTNTATITCPQDPMLLMPGPQPANASGVPVLIVGMTGQSAWMNGCASVNSATVSGVTLNKFISYFSPTNHQACGSAVQSGPGDYTDTTQGSNSNTISAIFNAIGWKVCDQNGFTFSGGNLVSGNCIPVGVYDVKDDFELKEGRRVWIHDNVGWNAWQSFVSPYGVALFTPRNSTVAGTEASSIADVTLENNLWLKVYRGPGMTSGDPGVGYGTTATLSADTTQGSIAVLEGTRFYNHNNLFLVGYNANTFPGTTINGGGWPATAFGLSGVAKNTYVSHNTDWYMFGVTPDLTSGGDADWSIQPSQACGVALWPQISIINSIGFIGTTAASNCYLNKITLQPNDSTRPCDWGGGTGNDYNCRLGGTVISKPTTVTELATYTGLVAPNIGNVDPTPNPNFLFKCELRVTDELGQDFTTPSCPNGIDYTFQNVAGWSDNSTGSWKTTDSTPSGVNWATLTATTKYVMAGSTTFIPPPITPTGTTLGTGGIGPGLGARAVPKKKPKK